MHHCFPLVEHSQWFRGIKDMSVCLSDEFQDLDSLAVCINWSFGEVLAQLP